MSSPRPYEAKATAEIKADIGYWTSVKHTDADVEMRNFASHRLAELRAELARREGAA